MTKRVVKRKRRIIMLLSTMRVYVRCFFFRTFSMTLTTRFSDSTKVINRQINKQTRKREEERKLETICRIEFTWLQCLYFLLYMCAFERVLICLFVLFYFNNMFFYLDVVFHTNFFLFLKSHLLRYQQKTIEFKKFNCIKVSITQILLTVVNSATECSKPQIIYLTLTEQLNHFLESPIDFFY